MFRGVLFGAGLAMLALGLWWSSGRENQSSLMAVTLFFAAFTGTAVFTRLLRRKPKNDDRKNGTHR